MASSNQSFNRDKAMSFLLGRIDYERAISIPYNQREFRLDRMRDLLKRLGDPHERLKIVHVAGTKGKGSTSAMIAATLYAAGYRTGLYTSPHLERIEERISVDDQSCSSESFFDLIQRIRPIVEQIDRELDQQSVKELGPTYFEILTAIAFLHFAEAGTDIAVIEVGLGGRLDSTNVCQPLVSVITSISFDHTQQLGNTLALIAGEKAGIIKPGVPVISGVVDEEPRRVIAEIAQQKQCRLIQLGVDFTSHYCPARGLDTLTPATGKMDFTSCSSGPLQNMSGVELGMLGRHQASNAAVAVAALAELENQGWGIPESAVRGGLASANLPARVEVACLRPGVVIDAAHNVASVQTLLETLQESFSSKRRLLVFAATQEKDVRGMLQVLLPHFEAVILTRYLNNPRAMDLRELETLVAGLSPIRRVIVDNPAAAWRQAGEMASAEHLICVTGSFFLAAEIRTEIAHRPLQSAET